MARSPYSPAERARLVARWRASGTTQSAFARRHGIHPRTFWGWTHDGPRRKSQAPRFVPVHVVDDTDDTTRAQKVGGLEIVLPRGVRIQVSPGTDPTWVAALLGGLQPSC